MKRTALMAAAIGLVAIACGNNETAGSLASGTPGTQQASLNGAGATFPGPLYLEWISNYKNVQPGVSINYQPIGSGGGVEQFVSQKTDFGASDAFLKDDEIAAAKKTRNCDALHIPTVFGAVAVVYNAEGLEGLTLDGKTLADIFLGKIKKYDDPAIKALNPGADLPSANIAVVHRSDDSGTTSIFTHYLASVSPEWSNKVGADKHVTWPTGIGGQGNDGVASAVQQNPGGLGYVELAYAIESDATTATLKNKDGEAIKPTIESTQAAAQNVVIPDDLRFNVLNIGGDGYPIVGATWILAWECGYPAAKATALRSFLRWALTQGDKTATDLHYAPVPATLQAKSLANVEKINAKR